jgi:heme ABC exporter ATP-binding subunit CcmA
MHEKLTPAVELQGIGRRFGRRWVLAHVDLEVAAGESILLAGPNGSGKTTLLRVIAGLSRPTAGRVRIFGRDPQDERLTCRASLSMVSHRSYLYDGLTPMEMVRTWARLAGAPSSDADLERLLDEVELEPHRDRLIGGFSAGMRKRLTLLRTRMEKPDLLILDEPLAALDAAGKRLIERWVAGELERGAAVIIASHAVERMSRLCERGVLLEQGQVTWEGAATGLLAHLGESA